MQKSFQESNLGFALLLLIFVVAAICCLRELPAAIDHALGLPVVPPPVVASGGNQ